MTQPFNVQVSGTDRYLEAAMSGLSARQRTIADNVANVETPGFKTAEVPFESTLRTALEGQAGATAPQQALNSAMQQTQQSGGSTLRADGNNVDIDQQMVELSQTTLSFDALEQVMSTRMGLLHSVINDGRG